MFSTGWEFLSTAPPTPVQNVTALQTSLETTKLDVEGMEIGSCDTMPSGTLSSVPPSLLLWPLPLNSPISFTIPSPDQLISTSLPGAVVVLLHWMCTSYVSPLQQQTLGEATFSPGHALRVGVQQKLSSHLSNCRSAGLEFIPLVFETLGGVSEDSISTLRSLGRSISLRTGPQDASTCSKQLFHRAAIALWRGNAGLWLHHQPSLHPSVDGLV